MSTEEIHDLETANERIERFVDNNEQFLSHDEALSCRSLSWKLDRAGF